MRLNPRRAIVRVRFGVCDSTKKKKPSVRLSVRVRLSERQSGAGRFSRTDLNRSVKRRRRLSSSVVMKYVVVSGGVVSGLGKGVTASSVGVLLKASGLRVTSVKIDPYINIDAGTMSPFEHGETYVLDDGGESDLDLGNYERFVDVSLTRDHNITTGKVYQVRGKSARRDETMSGEAREPSRARVFSRLGTNRTIERKARASWMTDGENGDDERVTERY